MYTPKAVANWFLDRFSGALTPMKLQKLMYFAQGWHLGLFARPLINEKVQAWRFGPVFASVYVEFKGFGNKPITRRARRIRLTEPGGELTVTCPVIGDDDKGTRDFLEKIAETYGKYSAIELSRMTHEPDTPWKAVWDEMGGVEVLSKEIPDELIAEYFAKKSVRGANAQR